MLGIIEQTRLDNGVIVVSSKMERVESVAVCVDAGVGGRNEEPSEGGSCHFLEHLLFKGSKKYPSTRAVSDAIEKHGGSINAFTTNEHTRFYARAPFDALRTMTQILGDIYTQPLFREKDINTERMVVLEEIKMYHDDDACFAADLAQTALWPKHALGRPILGTPKTLAAMNHEYLCDFHRSHYRAGSTIFAAAGKVEHEQFVKLVRPIAERLEGGIAPGFKSARKCKPVLPLVYEYRETEQIQAIAGFRSFSITDPRKTALAVLTHIFGRGMTSRLFMTLREKYGMAYSISADPTYMTDVGQFQIYGGLDPRRSTKAMELIGKELRKISHSLVTQSEFTRARSSLIGESRLFGETSAAQMAWITDKMRTIGKVEQPESVVERLQKVTRDDLLDVANDLFKPENVSLTLVLPRAFDFVPSPDEHLDALRSAMS